MIWTVALMTLAVPGPPVEPSTPPAPGGTEILVQGSPEPRPALKLRLFPERYTLVPGNAALFYHRAIQFAAETRGSLDRSPDGKPLNPTGGIEAKVFEWINGPIDRIPSVEAHQIVMSFEPAYHELDLGTMRRDCDWGHFDRVEGIATWLPEVQSMRFLARLIQLRILLAIRDGDFDSALRGIEIELVMARHVGIGPTLIQGMVGVAIANVASTSLEKLIQAPGSPNLYWALASRPHPLIDLTPAMEWEAHYMEREFPDLVGIDRETWDLARARHFAASFDEKLYTTFGGAEDIKNGGIMPLGLPNPGGRLVLATIAARRDAESRRGLLQAGFREDRLAAMPLTQLAVLDAYRRFTEFRDDYFKWQALPAWQAGAPDFRLSPQTLEQKRADPILAMFIGLMPAVNAARMASVQLERRLDALQSIEAIRMYCQAHGGQLPETLEAVTEAPVPRDPSTGKPFDYRRDGGTATLTSPVPLGFREHPSYLLRFLLKTDRRAD